MARAGCALLDREKQLAPSTRPRGRDVEALKRWCAARLHDRAYRGWVVFRFPENARLLAPRRGAAARAAAARSDASVRTGACGAATASADRPAYHAPREVAERDPLLRAVPRARQGLVLEGASRQGRDGRRQPARHRARGLPARREDLRDAHAPEGGDAIGALAIVDRSTTRCAPAPATASATTA